jgi:hypothetical protein
VNALFCLAVPPAPIEISPIEPPAGMTRRETLMAGVSSPGCLGCHSVIDPPGFSMEILAPETGEFRTTDNGLPIDASGTFTTQGGEAFMFRDIVDLSWQLSVSCDVSRCFANRLFDRATAVAGVPYEQADVDGVLYQLAGEQEFSIEGALVSLVQSPAFLR